MHYLVVLDCNTPIGRIYAGSNDGFVREGRYDHPVLRCRALDHEGDNYLQITCVEGASMSVPHGSVVAIYRLGEERAIPTVFKPSQQPSKH